MKFIKITNSSKEGTLKPYWQGWLGERFPDHFAQIGTINTLRLKNAVRDVARAVLGSVPPDIERMCKGFIPTPQGVEDLKFILGYTDSEGNVVPGSINTDKALQEYIRKYPDQWELAKASLALWRSNGRHAAGYVISNEPIDEFIPTTNVGGVKVLSFPGPQCESVGAIKMDFLVVNSVKDVQTAIKLIQSRHCGGVPKDRVINGKLVPGIRLVPAKDGTLHDIWELPEEQEVFDDLNNKTETVFQFDSAAARQGLKHFNGIIKSIDDMAIFTALDRPGPLDYYVSVSDNPSQKINILQEYSRRAKGLEGSPDIVKEMDALCPETKGLMIYQESLMRVYQYFTDCTLAEAEEFRRNVGKKKRDKIERAYGLFMERAVSKVSKESAQAVWDSIITFSAYGFNKSVSWNTEIDTVKDGLKQIKDIVPGDRVFTWTRDKCYITTEVVALHDHGELDGFEIEFDDGYKVTTSINHKFLVALDQEAPYAYVTEKSHEEQIPLYRILAEKRAVRCILPWDPHRTKVIVNVRPIGKIKMYDIEVAHKDHAFLLPNGIVTSNSHAVSYVTLSYACLYLKHHYPLEWWTAVLCGASKEEIDQKFWQHCGHLVLLPDIKLSKGNWEIEGDKIRAPISMLFGIGETAHKQLAQSAPYTDLKHFCQSIIDYRKSNAVYKDKTDKEGKVTKVKAWGRSALDIGKIHNMLYAGSLDSFFEGKTLSEAEEEYHKTMTELYAAEGQKYPKPKKKLPTLDPIGRYQAKKAVLPPYGADLRPLLIQVGLPENFILEGRSLRIKSKEWSRDVHAEVETSDPVVGGARIEDLERGEGFVEQNIKCGIIAYVEAWDGDKRKKYFSYGPNKEKEACKFFIEVEGRKREMVYWPNRDGELPPHLKNIEAGSIVAMIISKNSGRTDFNIRSIEVIRGPLDMKEKGKEDEKENKEEG